MSVVCLTVYVYYNNNGNNSNLNTCEAHSVCSHS